MVSNTVAILGATAFFVLFMGPILYLTWMSYKDDRHSPTMDGDDPDADAESA